MKVLILLILPVLARASDFIESVHAQGAEIAKEMVVEGNMVSWSPFSVVNVLPLINGDKSLEKPFKDSLEYFKTSTGTEVARLSVAYLKEKEGKEELAADYGVELADYPTPETLVETINKKYREEIGVPPEGLIPENLDGVTQLYLTSLLIKAEWESPFRYSQRGRFYLNETHAVKARYMKNLGYYKYGELDDVDAKILALPFKNSSTTYMVIILPNNSSGLSTVSQQFGKVQIGGMIQKLKTRRTQLTLPKISIDSQLVLQPKPTVKILQSGSFRLTYSGVDHRASKLRRSPTKYYRTRSNKEDLKFVVNHPFIFTIFDTMAGVLTYGEVVIPSDQTPPKLNLKSEPNQAMKLSQNAKSLSEITDELGNQLYQLIKTKADNFVLSPIVLNNLIASYVVGASQETSQLFFSNLNSKTGILELNSNIHYLNTSVNSNVTKIYGGTETFKESVQVLGTEVVPDATGETHGFYSYNYGVRLISSKSYLKRFYLNERDFVNARYHEFFGRVQYLTIPVWDAKVLQLYLSPTQSLLLFIPNERSGLHLIEEGLQDVTVSKLLCQMKERYVKLRLPSFEINYSADLLPDLKSIHHVDNLKFEGVGADKLTAINQNVTISIGATNENKFRVRSKFGSRRPPSTRLLTDRPFVYYLLDSQVGTLALGRVVTLPNVETPSVDAPSDLEEIKIGSKTKENKTETETVPIVPVVVAMPDPSPA